MFIVWHMLAIITLMAVTFSIGYWFGKRNENTRVHTRRIY